MIVLYCTDTFIVKYKFISFIFFFLFNNILVSKHVFVCLFFRFELELKTNMVLVCHILLLFRDYDNFSHKLLNTNIFNDYV